MVIVTRNVPFHTCVASEYQLIIKEAVLRCSRIAYAASELVNLFITSALEAYHEAPPSRDGFAARSTRAALHQQLAICFDSNSVNQAFLLASAPSPRPCRSDASEQTRAARGAFERAAEEFLSADRSLSRRSNIGPMLKLRSRTLVSTARTGLKTKFRKVTGAWVQLELYRRRPDLFPRPPPDSAAPDERKAYGKALKAFEQAAKFVAADVLRRPNEALRTRDEELRMLAEQLRAQIVYALFDDEVGGAPKNEDEYAAIYTRYEMEAEWGIEVLIRKAPHRFVEPLAKMSYDLMVGMGRVPKRVLRRVRGDTALYPLCARHVSHATLDTEVVKQLFPSEWREIAESLAAAGAELSQKERTGRQREVLWSRILAIPEIRCWNQPSLTFHQSVTTDGATLCLKFDKKECAPENGGASGGVGGGGGEGGGGEGGRGASRSIRSLYSRAE